MNRITYLIIVILFVSLLSACSEADSAIPVTGEKSDLHLTVESPNGESAFRQGEKAITYNYIVTNTGTLRLSGPVLVDDPPRQVACPPLSTVGNLDSYLDQNESVTCTSYYTPTGSDRGAGSITNRAKAIVGGAVSNETGITLSLGQAAGTPSTAVASQAPSLDLTATPDSSADTTQTPLVIPTSTMDSSADTTQTP